MNVWDKSVQAAESDYYWKGDPILYEEGTGPKASRLALASNLCPIVGDNRLSVVELFCGCGGTSLGFEMAGYRILGGIDVHMPSILTFKHNHPDTVAILGDIRRLATDTVGAILGRDRLDVLIGGIPCQGFSLANRKRNDNDARNFMYKVFIRFVRDLRPRAVMIENVSGIRTAQNGALINDMAAGIAEAGKMAVAHSVLYAPDYGVPQTRKRVVFIGLAADEAFDFAAIRATHARDEYVTVRDALDDLPRLRAGQEAVAYDQEPRSKYQRAMRRGASVLTCHRAPDHPESTIERIGSTKPGDPMYPEFRQRIRLAWDMLSPTQLAGGIRPQFQFGHPEDARGLTIRERCRLQSFPDTFEVCGGVVQGRVQTGNAVPPLLARAVALALKGYL